MNDERAGASENRAAGLTGPGEYRPERIFSVGAGVFDLEAQTEISTQPWERCEIHRADLVWLLNIVEATDLPDDQFARWRELVAR